MGRLPQEGWGPLSQGGQGRHLTGNDVELGPECKMPREACGQSSPPDGEDDKALRQAQTW